ncbi:hypothetical protein O6P37_00645 [Mycobacterium sp. CPCC 205372]|uniref:Uncharacterized protein n=1 Tax=Mycobacterium hippophais TaxID=3016340 RepID=A0ABT4PLD0_9MYCO|nr:hypothetical protein [Mycobacterium hippophais]MCZ8377360.1 hypothetical protein [Mycobacterium hippophais]
MSAHLMSSTALRRRRQAIIALGWSSVLVFGGWLGLHLVMGVVRGHSLVSGAVLPTEPIVGNGWVVDTAAFLATFAVLALILAGWQWLCSRLGDEPDPTLSAEDLAAQPLYIIEIPALNKAIVGSAIVCLVCSALLGSAVLPLIITKYGW